MVFDDVTNVAERTLLEKVSEKLGLDYKIIKIDTVRRQYKGGAVGVLNIDLRGSKYEKNICKSTMGNL